MSWEVVVISTLITSIATMIINIHQSVKQRHFTSECCSGSCKIESDSTHHDKPPDPVKL